MAGGVLGRGVLPLIVAHYRGDRGGRGVWGVGSKTG